MLTIICLLMFIFIIGLVIFRIFKYKFLKINRENIGLIIISGLLLTISDIQNVWYYPLLGMDVLLLVIFIGGVVKRSRQ
jgi:tellurite resistance protein TehA-like permease